VTLTTLEQEILAQLQILALPQQREVLAFVHTLATTPAGVPGHTLLAFADAFDPHDLAVLKQAIDEDCEQVNEDEW
jgi:hypothetical protein